MRIFVGLHNSTTSPPQLYEDIHKTIKAYCPPKSYEDIRRTTQSYCPPQSYEDIRRTTQAYYLDITHKTLQHHHLNHMRIFVGLQKSTVLILLIRLENES